MEWLGSFFRSVGQNLWELVAAPDHPASRPVKEDKSPSRKEAAGALPSEADIHHEIGIRNKRIGILRSDIGKMEARYTECLQVIVSPTSLPSQKKNARIEATQLKASISLKQQTVQDISSHVAVLEQMLSRLESSISNKTMQRSVVQMKTALGSADENDDLHDSFQETIDDLQAYRDTWHTTVEGMVSGDQESFERTIDDDLEALASAAKRPEPPTQNRSSLPMSLFMDDDSATIDFSLPSVPSKGNRPPPGGAASKVTNVLPQSSVGITVMPSESLKNLLE
ncbi:MAG: hypothetical protein AB7P49_00725 [Bdellovibrionales bacterium]